MDRIAARTVIGAVLLACAVSQPLAHAYAQSSLGIGTNEATLPSTGLFAHWLNLINLYQQQFYRELTGALKAMRTDGTKLWLLVALSFAYGIFHAAGPGHGKAVISSYMLANEVALRRGVLLSFISAFLQALTAIIVMALVFLVLRGTSISMTDATWFLEVASYALITGFGAWLLWKKLRPLFGGGRAHSLSAAAMAQAHHHHDHDDHEHHHAHDRGAHHYHHAHDHRDTAPLALSARLREVLRGHSHENHGHAHADGETCETCGHSHAPDPALLSGRHFDWRTAWSALVAVGLRPCSGALIVLSFAFLNGLWAGGILSVVAMAIGTGITVAALATIAVTAKGLAVRLAGNGRAGNRIHAVVEILGAAFVLVVGLLLLSASLMA